MSKIISVDDNVVRLANALKRAGAISVELHYSGSYDSIDDTYFEVAWPDTNSVLVTDDDQALGDVEYDVERNDKVETITSKFSKALKATFMEALTVAGHEGFEEDDGGSGSFTVYAEGYAHLEHIQNTTVTEETGTEFDEDSDQWENIKKIADVLKTQGATEVTVNYSGGGDSGDINDVDVTWGDGIEKSLPSVTVTHLNKDYVEGRWETTSSQTESNFEDAVSDIAWALVSEASHSGFENNEGGEGYLVITAKGTAYLNHTDNSSGTDDPDDTYFGNNIPDGVGSSDN